MASKGESTKAQRASPQPEHASPKKRRKDRPCARCVKRSIGHLCHDEPREPSKGVKHGDLENGIAVKHEEAPQYTMVPPQQPPEQSLVQAGSTSLASTTGPAFTQTSPIPISQPSSEPRSQGQVSLNNNQYYTSYNDWSFDGQNQFQDIHALHPSYMFNAPDINNEYNLLNEFLTSSLLDDAAILPNDEAATLNSDHFFNNEAGRNIIDSTAQDPASSIHGQTFETGQTTVGQPTSTPRPQSAKPTDKEEDRYYMTVADPSGNDTPQERMNKVFMAKYNAGMLRPFNYIQGYARLHRYMDQNIQPASRQRILRQLDKFRPKFRERMQSLTDMELTLVEMWFERSLMEYDRVFASMAIPACCWRRTGEIFRGNKEMAELIHVPIEELRDGKLALHEIVVEKDLVLYWDKFLAIAFDSSQKAILTSCSLKNPDLKASDPEIKCCFSFTIRRDNHNM
ncbi:Transcription factor [Lecanora helva]